MISYCLDTNIVSYLLKNNQDIVNRLKSEIIKNNKIKISLISYYEVLRGLKYIKNNKKIYKFSNLLKLFDLLEMKADTFETAANIYSELRKNGNLIDDADLLIAANCIVNDCVLITNNLKHFQRIRNLKCENWLYE
ncbi:MAG: type II toxin-antitoxin system VapC family toxin [Thermotogota bacterium]|nr:type II toxin-antitoxin system VapC family toxin [Thermotogota bacterium]